MPYCKDCAHFYAGTRQCFRPVPCLVSETSSLGKCATAERADVVGHCGPDAVYFKPLEVKHTGHCCSDNGANLLPHTISHYNKTGSPGHYVVAGNRTLKQERLELYAAKAAVVCAVVILLIVAVYY